MMSNLRPILFLSLLATFLYRSFAVYLNGNELQDLLDTTTYTQDSLSWIQSSTVPASVIDCGGQSIISSDASNPKAGIIQRTYNHIPKHKTIFAVINLWFIDEWTNRDNVKLFLDDSSINFGQPHTVKSLWSGDVCEGSSTDSGPMKFLIRLPHNKTSISVTLNFKLVSDGSSKAAAVQDIALLFSQNEDLSEDQEASFCGLARFPSFSWKCPCAEGAYKDSNGVCQFCENTCNSCFGPGSSSCFACANGAYFNGTDCVLCDSSCKTCVGSLPNQCTSCRGDYYFYADNTCLETCDAPYMSREDEDMNLYCEKSCAAGLFAYQNGSCLSSCDDNFTPRTESYGQYCDFACGAFQYLWFDQTCNTFCDSPYISRTQGGYSFCDFPCDLDEFFNYDSTCADSCEDPYIQEIAGDYKYCKLPCSENSFLYPNGSCLSNCSSPWHSDLNGDVKICKMYCDDPEDYYYLNGTCSSECPEPFIASVVDDFKSCDFPCSESQVLYYNGTCLNVNCQSPLISSTLGSSEYQTCEKPCEANYYLNLNGSCETSCPFPLVKNTEINVCESPCLGDEEYYDSSLQECVEECSDFQVVEVIQSVKVCSLLSNNNDTSSTLPNSTNNTSPSSNNTNNTNNTSTEPNTNSTNNSSNNGSNGTTPTQNNTTNETTVSNNTTKNSHNSPSRDDNSIELLVQVTSVLGGFTSVGSALHMSFATRSPTGLTLAFLMEIFMYIRYLSIRYPSNLQDLLDQSPMSPFWITFGTTVPESFGKGFTESEIPINFSKYHLHARFLLSSWNQLTFMLAVWVVGILSGVFVRFFKKINLYYAKEICRGIQIITRWNLLCLMFCAFMPYFVLYTGLEFMTAPFDSFADNMSFILCLFGLFTAFGIICFTMYLARKWMRLKNIIVPTGQQQEGLSPQKLFTRKWQRFQVLYCSYNSESIAQKAFLVPYLLRVMLIYLFVVVLIDYPLLQACLVNILSLVILGYLMMIKPLSPASNRQIIIYEVIILISNINVLFLALLDKLTHEGCNLHDVTETESELRVTLGTIIICCNLTFTLFAVYFLLSDLIRGIKYCWRATKALKKKGSRFWLQLLVLMFQSGGMSFDQIDLQQNSPIKPPTCRGECESPLPRDIAISYASRKRAQQNRSIAPLLSKPTHDISSLNLSDSKIGANGGKDSMNGERFQDTRDMSGDAELKSPIRPRPKLNLSILSASPMSFWSVSPKKSARSKRKQSDSDDIHLKSPNEIVEIDSAKNSRVLLESNMESSLDLENMPLRAGGSRAQTPKLTPQQEDLCTIDEMKEAQEETGVVKKVCDFKLELSPIEAFKGLNLGSEDLRMKTETKKTTSRILEDRKNKNKPSIASARYFKSQTMNEIFEKDTESLNDLVMKGLIPTNGSENEEKGGLFTKGETKRLKSFVERRGKISDHKGEI